MREILESSRVLYASSCVFNSPIISRVLLSRTDGAIEILRTIRRIEVEPLKGSVCVYRDIVDGSPVPEICGCLHKVLMPGFTGE